MLREDPHGRAVLHASTSGEAHNIFTNRLARAGWNTGRIHLLRAVPHHRLLALSALSYIILDWYPAGGCTTIWEVLVVGKALVTLPSRFLGGRWSYAYYCIIGDNILSLLVVAGSPAEYVRLAVELSTSARVRDKAELQIKHGVHRVYESRDRDSAAAWNQVFLDIAPVVIDEGHFDDSSTLSPVTMNAKL